MCPIKEIPEGQQCSSLNCEAVGDRTELRTKKASITDVLSLYAFSPVLGCGGAGACPICQLQTRKCYKKHVPIVMLRGPQKMTQAKG